MSMHEHEEYTEGSVFHSSQHPQIYPPEKSVEDRFFKQGTNSKKMILIQNAKNMVLRAHITRTLMRNITETE